MGRFLKDHVPWWVKFSFKIATGALGLGPLLHKAGVYSHGTKSVERDFNVFSKHFDAVRSLLPEKDFAVLEIGPGYSAASAVFATYYGATHTYFVDQGMYIRKESEREAKQFLKQKFDRAPESVEYTCLDGGTASLKELSDNSVDYIFSNSVLEHVRKDEMLPLLKECRRILTTGGVCSHWIDFKDHLGASLHSLRFSEKFWEGNLVGNAGFYTNRSRLSQLQELFEEAGFSCKIIKTAEFPKMKLRRSQFSTEFRDMSDKDMATAGCHVILTCK